MNKLLTVVVPTYNMEKYLDQCLSSLIVEDSKMELLEVLVINDGSIDGSSEIAHGYQTRFPQSFRVIDKENGNYGSCVNRGVSEAVGKYIKILDADDFVDSEGICLLIDYLSSCDADAVITGVIDVDGEGSVRGQKFLSLDKERVYSPNDIPVSVLGSLFMHELTYRTSIFAKIKYRQTEGISYTDLEWAYYPMSAVNMVSFYPVCVYCYRRGRAGQTVESTQRCKNMWMEEKIIMQMYSNLDENLLTAGLHSGEYMKNRLALFSSRLYFYYLLEYHNCLKEDKLRDFDKFVMQNSSELYKMISQSECRTYLGSFKYIKNWRKKLSRKTIKFMFYDTYRLVSNMRHYLIDK